MYLRGKLAVVVWWQVMQNNLGLIQALEHNGIDVSQLTTANQCANESGQPLPLYLAARGIISAQTIADACSQFFGLPIVDLHFYDAEQCPVNSIDIDLIKKHWILPLSKINNNLTLAICDPKSFSVIETIEFKASLKIKIVFAACEPLLKIINHLLSESLYKSMMQIETNENDYSITALVEQIVSDAVHQKASDIHFENFAHIYCIRMRIDGLLHTILTLPAHLSKSINSRLKILADLDIAERRKPQDGRFQFTSLLGIQRDCRVNFCPTIIGEKAVIRILDTQTQLLHIHQLGMTPKQEQLFLSALQHSQGLILVTGPTGSGKTITLYAALQQLDYKTKNITTVENPVEIQLNGINQISVNHALGLDFAQALRSLLRQDPDIIMIGEIRDEETAAMAIRAAQTGHLVIATLHTNNTVESINRLHNIGISYFNIASCLKCVVAQRLARRSCTYCNKKQSQDCKHCVDGYSGRTGIYELLPINTELQNLIVKGSDANMLKAAAVNAGMRTLQEHAEKLVSEKITTQAEVERVC